MPNASESAVSYNKYMAHVTRLAALTILLTVALAAQNKFTVASVKPSPSHKHW